MLFPTLDAPHHGFADADDEIIQPSVFFFAGIECLLQSGIVTLTTRLPWLGLSSFRDSRHNVAALSPLMHGAASPQNSRFAGQFCSVSGDFSGEGQYFIATSLGRASLQSALKAVDQN